ncbi:hypothetical protein [Cupriavidus sp. PET2-C1]
MKINRHAPRESRPCSRMQAAMRTLRRGVLLMRVLALCANSIAHAQPAAPAQSLVTPEQTFARGYLEAVSTGYDNGQALLGSEGIAPVRLPHSPALQIRPSPAPSAPAPTAANPSVVPVSQKTRRE